MAQRHQTLFPRRTSGHAHQHGGKRVWPARLDSIQYRYSYLQLVFLKGVCLLYAGYGEETPAERLLLLRREQLPETLQLSLFATTPTHR